MEKVSKEVIQSYLITTARYDFSADEKRVLTRIIEHLQKYLIGQKLDHKLEVDLFGMVPIDTTIGEMITGTQTYTQVRNAIHSLYQKTFWYADDELEKPIRFIDTPRIYKRGRVLFSLDKDLVECFLNMSKGYSKYELDVSLSFSSVYSMRLYELLSGQSSTITYKIETLKKMFKVEDKYKRNADFVRRVIDGAQTELNEKSPISFKYKLIKQGRAFHKIQFNVIHQPQLQNEDVEMNKLKRRVDTSLVLGRELYRYLKNTCGFMDRELKNNLTLFGRAVDKMGEEELLTKIREIWGRARTADNPKGYLINALKSMTNFI